MGRLFSVLYSSLNHILWHLMQSSVLKASLPLWQAPQDLPPLSMSPILALSAPALKGKILVWQSAHLYMPRWKSWLKVASPASVLKRMLPGLYPLWHLSHSPAAVKASLPLWQVPHDLPFSMLAMVALVEPALYWNTLV